MDGKVTKITNCRLIRDGKIVFDDIYIQNGVFLDPLNRFFNQRLGADITIDAEGLIVAPGYIDLQLNGGFGVDFSSNFVNLEEGLRVVSNGLLRYGVTSFVPTLVSSAPETYHKILPKIKPRKGSVTFGAEILGTHLEGPFINQEKKGAHEESYLRHLDNGFNSLVQTYGTEGLENARIITMAPELRGGIESIGEIARRGIVVSLGHSNALIHTAEIAVKEGATFITHLFNAMIQFHHRDPGLIGLLGSDETQLKRPYYSIICDGIHSHPNSVKIAYFSHPKGAVLVTDAMCAMGLPTGSYVLGTMNVRVENGRAYLEGTPTLAGSVVTMDDCVRNFKKFTGCSIVEAIESATLHPAKVLGIENRKGTLKTGADADFLFLDNDLNVKATYIAGELAWSNQYIKQK